MANSTEANRDNVEMGNARMLAAWKQGIAVSSPDGKKTDRVAIRETSNGNASKAERLRKYRAMSERIKETELTQITSWCIKFDRTWGPTFLCELSKICTKKVRQQIARSAIEQGDGLVELKRKVRLSKGAPASIASDTIRVGRKRALDWTQPTAILDEIHQVCRDFLTFVNDIDRVAKSDSTKSAVVKLLLKMEPQVKTAKKAISQLQTDCEAELKARR